MGQKAYLLSVFKFNFNIIKVATDLAGPIYCDNPEYNTGDVEMCKTWTAMIGAPSVKSLGALLRASAGRICSDLGCE